MIFGKHINRYYIKYAPLLLMGLIALVAVDALQLFSFVPFQQLLIPMVATFAAAGLFVGVVGSWTSIRKFMDV